MPDYDVDRGADAKTRVLQTGDGFLIALSPTPGMYRVLTFTNYRGPGNTTAREELFFWPAFVARKMTPRFALFSASLQETKGCPGDNLR